VRGAYLHIIFTSIEALLMISIIILVIMAFIFHHLFSLLALVEFLLDFMAIMYDSLI
jgi:hypothetical protein